jgi:hypothetical protein
LAQAPVVKAFTSSSGKDAGACSHWHGRIGCCTPLLALSLWLANTILVCELRDWLQSATMIVERQHET